MTKLYVKRNGKFAEIENSAEDVDKLTDGVSNIHDMAKDNKCSMRDIERAAKAILEVFKREV